MYYLYLLRCSDNSLYCGQTKDLKRRIIEHNSDKSQSKYTRTRRPVKLVYFEKYQTLSQALKREFEIKKMSKIEKEKMIIERHSRVGGNPDYKNIIMKYSTGSPPLRG